MSNKCVCSSLRNTVKEEYDAWLRLPAIRSVDVMASLDPLEWWKMHRKACSRVSGYSCIIRPFRESVFKNQVDPGASAMEPISHWLEALFLLKHNAWML